MLTTSVEIDKSFIMHFKLEIMQDESSSECKISTVVLLIFVSLIERFIIKRVSHPAINFQYKRLHVA